VHQVTLLHQASLVRVPATRGTKRDRPVEASPAPTAKRQNIRGRQRQNIPAAIDDTPWIRPFARTPVNPFDSLFARRPVNPFSKRPARVYKPYISPLGTPLTTPLTTPMDSPPSSPESSPPTSPRTNQFASGPASPSTSLASARGVKRNIEDDLSCQPPAKRR
jgi:hypothetical protein